MSNKRAAWTLENSWQSASKKQFKSNFESNINTTSELNFVTTRYIAFKMQLSYIYADPKSK